MKGRRSSVALFILILFFVGQCGKIREVPDELLGVWKTSEPKYADSSFEIRQDTIIFGLGDGEFDIYTIKYIKMKKVRDKKGILYIIHYEDKAGEKYILAFYYYPENNGVIRVKYQEEIMWIKEKG